MATPPTPTSRSTELDDHWYRAMFEASTVPMALADENGLLVVANDAYCAMVGRPWSQIAGLSSREFTHPDDLSQHRAMDRLMADAAGRGEILRVEKRYVHPDGAVRWGWVSASAIDGPGGQIWTMAVIHDTTDRRRAEDHLLTAATTDSLTGLRNRRGWMERLGAVDRTRERDAVLILAIIDLDRFKVYNDTHGHHAGDRLLADFAHAMVSSIPETATVARWGGEEFAVAVPDATVSEVYALLSRFAEVVPDGQTFSAGLAALCPEETVAECFTRADAHLYRAKELGRGQVVGD